MTPEVASAVDEIRAAFPGATVTVLREDGDGGAFVSLEPMDPGAQYAQRETFVRFHITFQYPYSDVYPLFVRADLSRVDGKGLGDAMSLGSFEGEPAVQISRRSVHLDPSRDTAAIKVVKVLQWLRTR